MTATTRAQRRLRNRLINLRVSGLIGDGQAGASLAVLPSGASATAGLDAPPPEWEDGRVTFLPSSRARLTRYDLARFPGDRLFDRLGRAICDAGSLPRKELYEAWEVAKRVRRLFRGGRVIDLGGGHGLLAQIMLLLDDSSPAALVVDTSLPPSSEKVHTALMHAWPRLGGRVSFIAGSLDDVEIVRGDVVVSSHACGALTDRVLERAASARARVAVLPCCHDLATCDAGELAGWVESAVAIDVLRAVRLQEKGYRIWTQTIPATITPQNRLLLGCPS
jgi:hypothetical protein